MRRGTAGEVARFAAVGVVNTLTYYGAYLLLVGVLPYLVAHVVAFVVSMLGSFLLNCLVTYRTRPTWRKLLLFPLTVAANFTITTVGVAVLVELLAVDTRVAPLLAAVGAIPLTFLATRAVLVGRGPAARGLQAPAVAAGLPAAAAAAAAAAPAPGASPPAAPAPGAPPLPRSRR